MADGVRLTAPTILLTEPSAPRTSSSAHLPRGALLAVGSSGGRRLVCALGDGLQHLPPALGAELPELLLPKPALCGRPLDLSVGAHRLVGHPLMLRVGQPAASADVGGEGGSAAANGGGGGEEGGSSGGGRADGVGGGASTEIRALSVAFVIDAEAPHDRRLQD